MDLHGLPFTNFFSTKQEIFKNTMYRNYNRLVQKHAQISPVDIFLQTGKQFLSKTVTLKEQEVHCLKPNTGYCVYFILLYLF